MSRTTTKTVAPTATETEDRRLERAARFRAREFLQEHSSLPRVRRCSFRPITKANGVTIAVGDGVAHFKGVQLCGSIHACPCCAPKIREGRSDEINAAAVAHLEQGGGLAFVTLTLSHGVGDDLGDLIDTLADGWRRIWQGRAGQARRAAWGDPGYVRALDFTHGDNGWHPHLHVLMFFPSPLDDDDLAALESDLYVPWQQWATEHGYNASARHGVRVDPVRTRPELGGYLAKINDQGWGAGRELARSDRKHGTHSGRTPWEILRSAHTNGDAGDLALWNVYEKATKGRRAITWSRGLKARYSVEEVTDEELAEAEVGGVEVVTFPTDVWARLRRRRGITADLLTAAELGGFARVQVLVAQSFGPEVALGLIRPDAKEPPP